MRRVKRASGGRLRAASLVEAVVAAVVLLIAFTAAMELLPRLTLRGDDALAVAEAEYRAMCAFDKYGSGVWPRARTSSGTAEAKRRYAWSRIGNTMTCNS